MKFPAIRMPALSVQQKKRAMAGGVLVAFIAAVVMLGPVTGFVTIGNPYEEMMNNMTVQLASAELSLTEKESEIEQCQSDLAGAASSLADSQNANAQCNSDLESSRNELSSANEQLADVRGELDVTKSYATQLENEKSLLESEKSQLESDKAQLQQDYDEIIANTATDLCCINRVFDASLTHYYVEDNIIVCTSEERGTEFSCA